MNMWDEIAERCTAAAPFFFAFVTSSGFAGLLAVVAAAIAFWASTRNSRKERWWKRAEYALNRVLSQDEAVQLVGLAMLQTLRSRDRREQNFIKAATDVFLDPKADGDDFDDEPVPPVDGASVGSAAPTSTETGSTADVGFVARASGRAGGFLRGFRRQCMRRQE